MSIDEVAPLDRQIKAVMGRFCSIARERGIVFAQREATTNLVAAAAYLEETAGPARTKQILSATLSAIGLGTTNKH